MNKDIVAFVENETLNYQTESFGSTKSSSKERLNIFLFPIIRIKKLHGELHYCHGYQITWIEDYQAPLISSYEIATLN